MNNSEKNKKRVISFTAWFAYILIFFEMLYMATPFAVFFYSVYGMPLKFLNSSPVTGWLIKTIFPHFIQTDSVLISVITHAGWPLMGLGLIVFLIGFVQIYWSKFRKKGAVTGGIYKFIRHPQYLAWSVFGLGMALVWSRMIVWIMYVTMLFVYYILARIEERECLEKYPDTYKSYYEKTGMFFFKLNLPWKPIFKLPSNKVIKVLTVIFIYLSLVGLTIVTGFALRTFSFSRISTVYNNNYQAVSITQMPDEKINTIINISINNNEANQKLKKLFDWENDKKLFYIVPVEWSISELGIDNREYELSNSPLSNPTTHGNTNNYNKNTYKILFSKAVINNRISNNHILSSASTQIPKLLVYVDLIKNEVTKIEIPPVSTRYKDIPVPIY